MLTKENKIDKKIISLHALQEDWLVCFVQKRTKKIQIQQVTPAEIHFFADHQQIEHKQVIEPWLKQYAKQHLTPWLDKISTLTGLEYNTLSIRGQRTRWGSCNEKKSITLNYKLLFLPARLVEHLLLHELCHTVHLNHSNHFWQLLAQHDRHWHETRRLCQKAHHYIPPWLER